MLGRGQPGSPGLGPARPLPLLSTNSLRRGGGGAAVSHSGLLVIQEIEQTLGSLPHAMTNSLDSDQVVP